MTTTGRSASESFDVLDSAFEAEREAADGDGRGTARSLQTDPEPGDAAGTGEGRRKRRRQRSQRGKRRRALPGRIRHLEFVSRERIFQELEGLLRQIREEAEESSNWAEEEINGIAHAVTSFTKVLEDESDPISERTRGEYQRIRDKLTQALRGER